MPRSQHTACDPIFRQGQGSLLKRSEEHPGRLWVRRISMEMRVYIAKITFTTLIDHFTSFAARLWFIVTNL